MKQHDNYIFRPVKITDLKEINDLAKKAKSGLSNLPKNIEQTKQLINFS